MAEWLKATVLKTVVRSRVPRVRIPVSPQENKLVFSQFIFCGKIGQDKNPV